MYSSITITFYEDAVASQYLELRYRINNQLFTIRYVWGFRVGANTITVPSPLPHNRGLATALSYFQSFAADYSLEGLFDMQPNLPKLVPY